VATTLRRRNEPAHHWLRAAGIALATYAGLVGMDFQPAWGAAAFALIAGFFAVASVDLGIVVSIFALALPLCAANAVIGIAFLIIGMLGVRYLGNDGGRAFLLIAAAIAGVAFGPAWAAVAIAGYLLGSSGGAVAAAVACVTVEVFGLALGSSAPLGAVTVNSGAAPLVVFSKAPESLFSTSWMVSSFGAIDAKMVDGVVAGFGAAHDPLALVAQPLIWALGAAVTGVMVAAARKRGGSLALGAAVAAGVLVPAIGSAIVFSLIGARVEPGALVMAAASSMALAAIFAVFYERFFPLVAVPVPSRVAKPASMAAEDADVDELLRLVATAEERLASQHTTRKVVMITDMKSFSRMTEEDGSILTAKAIQKHRDLLLPIIESHGGHGKSTGGDGLVAAFELPSQALSAAVEMQVALDAHNTHHAGQREMAVRIGVADGEVVLDKSGRPFIGAALNLAARVMNLADGGQAFATGVVVSEAGSSFAVHSHGDFQLKNIAAPVEVFEILWKIGRAHV